jgi:hypothetical protein
MNFMTLKNISEVYENDLAYAFDSKPLSHDLQDMKLMRVMTM